MSYSPGSPVARIINNIEETLIALILGLMTIITFANVVARYVFNSNILWALEATGFLFAWLVLIGAAYVVKISGHLGVDVVVKMFSAPMRKNLTLIAGALCLIYAVLLLIGTWQYWSPFVGKQAWYEVDDIHMPDWLRFIEPILNEGEAYEKLPRFIPYFALPLGMVLLTWRFAEAVWNVAKGRTELLIASHEAEEMVDEAAAAAEKNGDRG